MLWNLRRAAALAVAVACLFASTESAHAELISALIVAALTSVGVSSGVASVIASVVTIAIGIGLSLLLAPKPPKPDGGGFSVQQSLPPIRYGYGEYRTAGAIAFKESSDGLLIAVLALAGHRISEFMGFYLNDDRVTLSGSGTGSGVGGHVEPFPDARYHSSSSVDIDSRVGLSTETAYDIVASVFPDEWSSDHRGDDTATMMVRSEQGKLQYFGRHFPYGQPDGSAIIRAYHLFDPRTSPAQDPDDAATFAWDSNAGQALMHFCCFSDYGLRKDYHVAVEPVLDHWIEQLNICDELMEQKEGSPSRRYRLGGENTTEADNRSTIKAMLTACDGVLKERGDGSLRFWAGKFQTPTVTIEARDISAVSLQSGLANEESNNVFKVSYASPDNDYAMVETDTQEWTEDQTRRGRRNPFVLDARWCQWVQQASRLNKRQLIRAKSIVRGSMVLRWAGINAAYERWVQLPNSNALPAKLRGEVIEVRKSVISPMNATITIEFIVSGAEIDDYDPETDESNPAPVPTRPDVKNPPIPANVLIEAFDPPGTGIVSLDISFDTPIRLSTGAPRRDLGYEVQWRIKDGGGGVPGAWINADFGNADPDPDDVDRIHLTVENVPPNTVLEVRVQSTRGSYESGWSEVIEVNTTLSDVPSSATLTDDDSATLTDDDDVFIMDDT